MNTKPMMMMTALFLAGAAFGWPSPSSPAGVTLAWGASSSPAVIGYRLYWGSASRAYTNLVDAGNVTEFTITNRFDRGVTYYFAATAYETNGLESDFSNEASYQWPLLPGAPTALSIVLSNLSRSVVVTNVRVSLRP